MSGDRLKTGIQQCRVRGVIMLVGTDLAGERDLGQDAATLIAGMHRAKTGERRTVVDAPLVQALAHFVATLTMRVRGEKRGNVVRSELFVVGGVQ
jgi:hypothetical protein